VVPKFSSHPSNQTMFEGENATISCNVTGTPPIVVTWEKDGTDFKVSSDSRLQSSNDGQQLTVTQVVPLDSGSYVCVANNSIVVKSYPGNLLVRSK
jgi:hypothetical protein